MYLVVFCKPDTHWLFVHQGVKRSKPAASQAPPTLSPPPEGVELREEDAERPRKKSRAMSSEEEILPTQTVSTAADENIWTFPQY